MKTEQIIEKQKELIEKLDVRIDVLTKIIYKHYPQVSATDEQRKILNDTDIEISQIKSAIAEELSRSEPDEHKAISDKMPEPFITLFNCLQDGCYEINFYGNDGNDNQEKIDGKELLINWIKDAYNESKSQQPQTAVIPDNGKSEEALNNYAKKCVEDFTKPSGIAMGWRACYEWIITQSQPQTAVMPTHAKDNMDFLEVLTKWCKYYDVSFCGKETAVIESALDEYLKSKVKVVDLRDFWEWVNKGETDSYATRKTMVDEYLATKDNG